MTNNYATPVIEQLEHTSNGLVVRAPAKINLCLLIGGKRPDGFHEIKTIMAKIDWHDELLFEQSPRDGIELICRGDHWAPQDKTNLVYRAIELFAKETGISPKVKVTLTKNIPAGSGLGSASSDAAAALVGFNTFTKAALPLDRLAAMAAVLGSDVPFFLGGPLALCTGRGEKISQIDKKFDFSAILILPNINTSTKRVYENYSHDPTLFERLNNRLESLLKEKKVDLIAKMCANMLERSCFALHPEIAGLKNSIENLGITPLCLSGSGSTLYHLMETPDRAAARKRQMIETETGCGSVVVYSNSW
jgi:4-diphosphocytidyl-2-C-methyl-D-erythritol kinase